MNIALILAGGIGERTTLEIPKQFICVNDKPIIVYTLEAFQHHPDIDAILTVCLDGWHDVLDSYAKQFNINKLKWIVSGGQTGQESIKNGLRALKEHCQLDDAVLIHDAVRPLVSVDIITDNLRVFHKFGNAFVVFPCSESVARVSDDGITPKSVIPHTEILKIQAPQTNTLGKLLWAHEQALTREIPSTVTTCVLMDILGETVHFSKGSEANIKLTTKEDIEIFKALRSPYMGAGVKSGKEETI